MALGDGIRRNVTTVTQEERDRLQAAFLKLQKKLYPGNSTYSLNREVGLIRNEIRKVR